MTYTQMPTILCIGDEETRLTLEKLLVHRGYHARMAADDGNGLILFREEMPDLVLSNWRRPGIDGEKMLTAIRHDAPQTPVIVFVNGVADAVSALNAGARDKRQH